MMLRVIAACVGLAPDNVVVLVEDGLGGGGNGQVGLGLEAGGVGGGAVARFHVVGRTGQKMKRMAGSWSKPTQTTEASVST